MGMAGALVEALASEDGDLEETVRPGTFFVVVDVAVAGGRMAVDKIFKGVKSADAVAAKYRNKGRNVQVIDALWFNPARKKLQAAGIVPASEDLDEMFSEAVGELTERKDKGSVVDQMRQIVKEKQYRKINGYTVDMWTASHVVQVYDALNPANQKKLDSLPITRMVDLVWKLVKKIS